MSDQHNNKRIAKNTLMLYMRMIVITIVSFYTTRITLQLLGVEDYGIRNVVSGIIGFMSIITTAMVNAAQRFLAFDLGKRDSDHFQRTFSMLINVFFVFSLIGVVLLEMIGPFLINHYLVIPPERIKAAHWIFQFSVVSFVVSTMVIPFTSAVIAYEKMNVFAYVSLLDAILKLVVVYLLYITPIDKLITVVFLTAVAHIISNFIYVVYCHAKLEGCRYYRCWDKELLNKLSSFMGWNLFGSATSVMNVHGQAILLNMFFGPVVNAAKGIADNVNTLAQSFVSNFYMAVGPQIVKTYANNDLEYTLWITITSTKLAFFLISLLALPLISNMEPILSLWLGKEYVSYEMVVFAQWTLIHSMIQSFDYPITQTVRATGDIKDYQIKTGLQTLSFIPICYIAFKLGAPAITSMIILVCVSSIVLLYRISKFSHILSITIGQYFRRVIVPAVVVVVAAGLLMSLMQVATDTIPKLILSLGMVFFETIIIIIIFGLNKKEKGFLMAIVKKRLRLIK